MKLHSIENDKGKSGPYVEFEEFDIADMILCGATTKFETFIFESSGERLNHGERYAE